MDKPSAQKKSSVVKTFVFLNTTELYQSSIVILVLDESGPDPQLLFYQREPQSFAIRDWPKFCNRQRSRQALRIETQSEAVRPTA